MNLVAAGLGIALVPDSVGTLMRSDIAYRSLAGPAPIADAGALHRAPAGAATENLLSLMRDALGRTGEARSAPGSLAAP